MSVENDSFIGFLEARRQDLRRIAAKTCGEFTYDDACSEAWLISLEIFQKRGLAIDFANKDDQSTVLSWLYAKLVRYADKSVRFAVKLDRDWDTEDADAANDALARLLVAPEQFDPLVKLLDEEERFDPVALIRHSYSQASAYVLLLHRFDWDLESLADHLRLLSITLRSKVRASGIWMKQQPSLFDRINTVDPDFVPHVAKRVAAMIALPVEHVQTEWDYPDWGLPLTRS